MKKIPFADTTVIEEFCNMRCLYCDDNSEFRYNNGNIITPKSWFVKKKALMKDKVLSGLNLWETYSENIEILIKKFDVHTLKISGGEIFLDENLLFEFLEKYSNKFAQIQILTNASRLEEETMVRLKQYQNIVFQISLDGIDKKTNFARTRNNAVLQKKILSGIQNIISSKIPIEINSVLTKYNTARFDEFLDFFSETENLVIFPRPVRNHPELFPVLEDIKRFAKILYDYPKYEKILPHKNYISRIYSVLKAEKDWKCYVPRFVIGMDNYGEVKGCTCSSVIPNKGKISELTEYNTDSYSCSLCTTQYELFNMLIDKEIKFDELFRIPSLSKMSIIPYLKETIEDIIK
ncbi:MAG TPA: radical SAM protein [Candidatus Woesearchaeota archaeon]|nr:radical SAM protein [Candidatus Woesearchaeota archaeon]